MSKFSHIERLKLEKVLEMQDGYILDFSNRTFEEFFTDTLEIEIYSEKYMGEHSGSKANTLREFWSVENDYIVGKSILELLDYKDAINHRSPSFSNIGKEIDTTKFCRELGLRLKNNSSVINPEVIVPVKTKRENELLVKVIQDHLDKNQPELAIDRLHTYSHSFFRNLCDIHSIPYVKKDTVNVLYRKYLDFLNDQNLIKSEIAKKILRAGNSIFDSLGFTRNNESLAHDNEVLVTYDEALLVFNQIITIFKYIQSREELFEETKKKLKKELIDDSSDDLPF